MNRITKERCRSGRSGRSRKPLCLRVPRVRIPVFPQNDEQSRNYRLRLFLYPQPSQVYLSAAEDTKKPCYAQRSMALRIDLQTSASGISAANPTSREARGFLSSLCRPPPPGSAQLIPPRTRCKKYHLAQRGNPRKNRLSPSPISLLSHGPRNFFSYVFQGQTYINKRE